MIYRFERRGRTPRAMGILAVCWLALVVLRLGLSLAWGWLALGALATLPLAWQIAWDKVTWLEVHRGRIAWSSALRSGDRADIDHVRINRAFDGGFRVTLIHPGEAQTRLPPDVVPPVNAFEAALQEAGIASQRHPFAPF